MFWNGDTAIACCNGVYISQSESLHGESKKMAFLSRKNIMFCSKLKKVIYGSIHGIIHYLICRHILDMNDIFLNGAMDIAGCNEAIIFPNREAFIRSQEYGFAQQKCHILQ